MGFYGNITNQSSTQFKFDKIYNNRVTMDAAVNSDGVYIGRYVLVEYGDDTLKQSSLVRAYLKEIDTNNNAILYSSPNFEKGTRLYVAGDSTINIGDGQKCNAGTVIYVLPEDSGNIVSYTLVTKDESTQLTNNQYLLTNKYFVITSSLRGNKNNWTHQVYSEQGSNANKKVIKQIQSDIKEGKSWFYWNNANKIMELVTSIDEITEDKLINIDGGFWTFDNTKYEIADIGTEYNDDNYYFSINRDQLYAVTTYYLASNDTRFIKVDFPNILEETGNIGSYVYNYNCDIAEYGAGRGYDSTVWQKVFENNVAKYVMIAELNAVVPTFDISADAPSMSPVTPHFDKDSTNVYYKVHWQPQWGLRVKAAENYEISPIDNNGVPLTNLAKIEASTNNTIYPSDGTTQWIKYEYDSGTGAEQNYIFDVSDNSWVPFDEKEGTPLKELGAAIYFNNAGFDPENDHKAEDEVIKNSDWDPTLNEIKIEPTGQSGHRYNLHGGSTKAVQEDIQEISVMLPGIGDAVAKMWDAVYGDRGQNQKYNTELLNNADGHKRNTDIAWRTRTDNTDNEKDYRLRGTLDELGNLRSYADKTSATNTLAGCINSVHDLMGMIIREENPENGHDPNAIYFNDNTYYRLQKKYIPSIDGTTKLTILDNNEKENYYYKVGENYYKATKTTPTEYSFYEINPDEDFEEKTLGTTWAKGEYWYQTTDANGALVYVRDNGAEPKEEYSYYIAGKNGLITKYKQFYQQGKQILENIVIDSVKKQKTYREKNQGYFYKNGEYYYTQNNSINTQNYAKNTYYILDSNNIYVLDGSDNFDKDKTYYNRNDVYVLETIEEENFTSAADKTYYVLPNKTQYIYKTFNYIGAEENPTDWQNLPDADWELVSEEYVEDGNWSALSVDDLVKFEENKYYSLKEIKDNDTNTYQCTVITKEYLGNNNLYGTALLVCEPNFAESAGFYTPGTYYYIQDNNYLKDNSLSKDENRTYYKLVKEPTLYAGPNPDPDIYKDYKEQYFFDENKTYYDANGEEIESKEYIKDTDYYQLNNLYIIASDNNAFRVGEAWNEELSIKDEDWQDAHNDAWGDYKYIVPENIEGIQLAYLEDTGDYVSVELTDFAKKLNTIHGLILKVNQVLGENPENYLGPIDLDTVNGCINKMKDIIYKIESLTPGDIAIVDDYGRIHGSAQTTAQGFGYTNIGTGEAQAIGTAEEDQFIQLDINSDENKPLITITHKEIHSIDDTETVANKNTQSNSDSGLNTGVGDTLKLYTPIVDNAGHVVGKNTETVTLPYGFKTITTNGRNSNNNTTTLSKQSNVVADNTQDTLAINSGNEWVKIETDATNDKITISHDVKKTTTSTSTQNLSNEESKTVTFIIPTDTFDGTNHFTNKDTKTVTMPNSYGKFTGDSGSSEATATHDTFAINGDSWIQTTATTDKIAFAHIGPVEVDKRNPENKAPAFGDTFTIEDWRFDSKGHKAGVETHTVKVPGMELVNDTTANENVVTGISYSYDSVNHKGVFTEQKENLGTLTLPTYSFGSTAAAAIAQNDTLNTAFAKTQASINLINNTTIPNAITTCETYTDTAITNLINGAPGTLDTLKEIADWIAADETGTTALTNRVGALETRATTLETNLSTEITNRKNGDTDTLNSAKSYTDTEISSAKSYTDTEVSGAKTFTTTSINNLNLGTMAQKSADDYLLAENYKIPAVPTTAGTYTLQATVDADGNITYNWIIA